MMRLSSLINNNENEFKNQKDSIKLLTSKSDLNKRHDIIN